MLVEKLKKKKLKRLIAGFKNEAAELTNFIMGHLSLLDAQKSYAHIDDARKGSWPHDGEWNFCFCSLEENSLLVVIWWLFCHYADIWCAYSTKKHLKRFLRHLFLFTLPCSSNHTSMKDGKVQESFCQAAFLRRICLAFLRGATSQKQLMLSKSVSSSFCSFLKNCLSPILSLAISNDLDLHSSPNWVEVLNMLDKGRFVFFYKEGFAMHDGSLSSKSENGLSNLLDAEHCDRRSLSSLSFELKDCESLLNLFCEIPIHYGRKKSFTFYSTYILNIERLLLSNILNHNDDSSISDRCELLRLFILCRRAIRHLVVALFANMSGVKGSLPISTVFYCPYSVLWLFKSVYRLAELPHAFFGDGRAIQVQKMMSYLLDHTSLVFQKISEATVSSNLLFLVKNISIKEKTLWDDFGQNSKLPESERSPRPFTCEDWEYVDIIADDLKKHMEKLSVTLKDTVHCIEPDGHTNSLEWSKISCIISCFHGLMLGISAAYDSTSNKETMENQTISSLMRNCFFRLSDLVNIFVDFSILCLKILFVNHGVVDTVVNLMGDSEVLNIMEGTVARFAPIYGSNSSYCRTVKSVENHAVVGIESKTLESLSSSNQGNKRSGISTFLKQRSPSSSKKWAINFLQMLNKVDLLKFKYCLGYLIPDFLDGKSPQIAFIHRQLIVTSATLLKLKWIAVSDVHFNHQSHDSFSVFIVDVFATSYILMQEFSEMIGDPCWFCFAQLNGILEFFDVLGCICSFSDPDISNDFYTRLIELHLKALGNALLYKEKHILVIQKQLDCYQ
ncbi:hypothetical protein HPP92_026151 [Vanilla planifolia]|uniref:Uncharacterized protein n=1 Tax=Vanilla planifolia TaxID=51239 RepID=A0A835PFF5_VANPL|nr:hypothetical protein HPP92_026151 [Vanilla planifolia]